MAGPIRVAARVASGHFVRASTRSVRSTRMGSHRLPSGRKNFGGYRSISNAKGAGLTMTKRGIFTKSAMSAERERRYGTYETWARRSLTPSSRRRVLSLFGRTI